MSTRTDILLDEELQLLEDATTMDLVEGESTAQHQQLLLRCPKGSWKENPATGVGLDNWLEHESPADLLAEIGREYRADGMRVDLLRINEQGLIEIQAAYDDTNRPT